MVSTALVIEEDRQQQTVYYISKMLLDADTRYLPLEKLLLALVTSSRKLRHYFLPHRIEVPMVHPLASVMRKADLSGRVAAWSVELGEYDLHFIPCTTIKGKVLADFVTEFSSNAESTSAGDPENQEMFSLEQFPACRLFVDGLAFNKGLGT